MSQNGNLPQIGVKITSLKPPPRFAWTYCEISMPSKRTDHISHLWKQTSSKSKTTMGFWLYATSKGKRNKHPDRVKPKVFLNSLGNEGACNVQFAVVHLLKMPFWRNIYIYIYIWSFPGRYLELLSWPKSLSIAPTPNQPFNTRPKAKGLSDGSLRAASNSELESSLSTRWHCGIPFEKSHRVCAFNFSVFFFCCWCLFLLNHKGFFRVNSEK